VRGLFYGDPGQLVAQVIAIVVAASWAFGLFYLFFTAQKKFMGGLRSSESDEITGLDATEMGVLAYPDFVNTSPVTDGAELETAGGGV